MKSCNCTPPVSDPKFRAHIATGGICIFSPGRTIDEALANVKAHAKKDKIPKPRWAEVWVENLDGDIVLKLP